MINQKPTQQVLKWLLTTTRGGNTRTQILKTLKQTPQNTKYMTKPTSHPTQKKLQNNKPPSNSPRKTQASNPHGRQLWHHLLPITNYGRELHPIPRNNKHKKDNKNGTKMIFQLVWVLYGSIITFISIISSNSNLVCFFL